MTMDQNFPGKVSHWRHVFLYLAQWSSRIERCTASADAELVEDSWPNQEPLSLSARILFFFGENDDVSVFFGPIFSFSLPKNFFLLLICPRVCFFVCLFVCLFVFAIAD